MNIEGLRQSARTIWEAALDAANPATCIRNVLQVHDAALRIAGREIAMEGRLIVIGTGKASARMAQVVEDILDSRIAGGVVVTKYGHALPLRRIRLLEAGHP